jgi:pSer/pThr/pTyr-binding forkhead associated (FHA) protein
MQTFWECCGARGPLILEVKADGDCRAVRHVFDRPFALIGSGLRSDLHLDHPDVSRRHAYVQVIAGKPYCLDLDSRTGIHQDAVEWTGGCLEAERPIRIGPFSIRAEVADVTATVSGIVQNPLSVPHASSDPFPRPTLAFQVPSRSVPTSVTIGRTLSLIGRSDRCKIRLEVPEVSRFLAALLRTPGGTWAVDLRSSDRLSVNGACMEYARLEQGDEIRIGSIIARVCEVSTASAMVRVPSRSAGEATPAIRPPFDTSATDIRTFLDQVAEIQHQSNDQFRQVILMVTQLFGSMHRETMDLVHEELEQIRILSGELKALREESAWGRSIESASESMQNGGASLEDRRDARAGTPRDPGEIHLIVSERLAAFERERQGRWNSLSKILGKTGS